MNFDLFNKKKLAKAHKANNLLIAEIWKMKKENNALLDRINNSYQRVVDQQPIKWENNNLKIENTELKSLIDALRKEIRNLREKNIPPVRLKLGPKKRKK